MDQLVQAIVLGIVQGLTEFLPISSSGHLIVVPALLGWDDPFIDSLAFSVMLHIATLLALLIYFRADWLRLIPAGLAAIRDRSFAGDPDRRLAWLLAVSTVPAVIAGVLLNDIIETRFRENADGYVLSNSEIDVDRALTFTFSPRVKKDPNAPVFSSSSVTAREQASVRRRI